MSLTFQQYPGRVEFNSVFITKGDSITDITSLVVEVNVYSSIIDVSSVGNFMIIDAKNVLSNLPIESGDPITFSVRYSDVEQTHTFIISKIENIQNHEKQKTYTIKGISELLFRSMSTSISQSFRGTTSEIAQRVFIENTSEKFGIWEQSQGIQSLIVPNWNPIKTISWLAKRSKSFIDDSRFLFYQDSLQKYHFTPIEVFRDLYKNNPPLKYTYRKNNEMVGKQNSIPNSKAVMETILALEFHDSFDIEEQLTTGKGGGTRFVTDLNTKTQKIITYDYWRDFKRDRTLNGNPVWKPISGVNGYLQFDTVLSNIHENITLNKINDRSSIRVTGLDKSQFITIVVHGNQTVELGQVLDIEIPTMEPRTSEMRDQLDQRWSGKYYVIAKRDMFNKEKKQTALTLAKESFITNEGL